MDSLRSEWAVKPAAAATSPQHCISASGALRCTMQRASERARMYLGLKKSAESQLGGFGGAAYYVMDDKCHCARDLLDAASSLHHAVLLASQRAASPVVSCVTPPPPLIAGKERRHSTAHYEGPSLLPLAGKCGNKSFLSRARKRTGGSRNTMTFVVVLTITTMTPQDTMTGIP